MAIAHVRILAHRTPSDSKVRGILGLALVALCYVYPAYQVFGSHSIWQNRGILSEVVLAAVLLASAGLAILVGELAARLAFNSFIAVVLGLVAGPASLYLVERLLDALLTTQYDTTTRIWQNSWSVALVSQGPLVFKAALPAAVLWFVSRVAFRRRRQRNDA